MALAFSGSSTSYKAPLLPLELYDRSRDSLSNNFFFFFFLLKDPTVFATP
jgi:hypothetical protein